ncbi:acyltransferase family protein, partial [Porphyromonas sp.]
MTSIKPLQLGRLNTQVLRGLAILSIITHNFTHGQHGAILENEFTYQAWHVDKLLSYLSHPDYRLPLQLFSFFGHYGVVLFVFLSAYGLERKYGHTSKNVKTLPFIWKHYLKLVSMCVVGCIPYFVINLATTRSLNSLVCGLLSLISMLHNLEIIQAEIYDLGPYWYFGLMFELYIVYRLFLFRRSCRIIVGVIILSLIAQAMEIPNGETMEWLRNNFIGSILPFGLGLLYARYEEEIQLGKGMHLIIALSSVALIFVTSLSFIPWLFTPIFVCTLGISVAQLLPRNIQPPILWVGGISATIFV